MNFDEIKEIIREEGGKVVIVEHDKPQMIIMSFAEWKKARGKKEERESGASRVPVEPAAAESLTIDDLPL